MSQKLNQIMLGNWSKSSCVPHPKVSPEVSSSDSCDAFLLRSCCNFWWLLNSITAILLRCGFCYILLIKKRSKNAVPRGTAFLLQFGAQSLGSAMSTVNENVYAAALCGISPLVKSPFRASQMTMSTRNGGRTNGTNNWVAIQQTS